MRKLELGKREWLCEQELLQVLLWSWSQLGCNRERGIEGRIRLNSCNVGERCCLFLRTLKIIIIIVTVFNGSGYFSAFRDIAAEE